MMSKKTRIKPEDYASIPEGTRVRLVADLVVEHPGYGCAYLNAPDNEGACLIDTDDLAKFFPKNARLYELPDKLAARLLEYGLDIEDARDIAALLREKGLAK